MCLSKQNALEENEEAYLLVPKQWLQSITQNQERILSLLEDRSVSSLPSLGNYITETEAKQLLNKKTTWFWKMRNSGQLPSAKIGGTNYYDKSDILRLLEKT